MICRYKRVKNIDKAVMFLWWLLKVLFKLFKGDRHTYIYIYIYSIIHILKIVFPDTRNVKYLPIFNGRYSMA